jgi:hypothetical protein
MFRLNFSFSNITEIEDSAALFRKKLDDKDDEKKIFSKLLNEAETTLLEMYKSSNDIEVLKKAFDLNLAKTQTAVRADIQKKIGTLLEKKSPQEALSYYEQADALQKDINTCRKCIGLAVSQNNTKSFVYHHSVLLQIELDNEDYPSIEKHETELKKIAQRAKLDNNEDLKTLFNNFETNKAYQTYKTNVRLAREAHELRIKLEHEASIVKVKLEWNDNVLINLSDCHCDATTWKTKQRPAYIQGKYFWNTEDILQEIESLLKDPRCFPETIKKLQEEKAYHQEAIKIGKISEQIASISTFDFYSLTSVKYDPQDEKIFEKMFKEKVHNWTSSTTKPDSDYWYRLSTHNLIETYSRKPEYAVFIHEELKKYFSQSKSGYHDFEADYDEYDDTPYDYESDISNEKNRLEVIKKIRKAFLEYQPFEKSYSNAEWNQVLNEYLQDDLTDIDIDLLKKIQKEHKEHSDDIRRLIDKVIIRQEIPKLRMSPMYDQKYRNSIDVMIDQLEKRCFIGNALYLALNLRIYVVLRSHQLNSDELPLYEAVQLRIPITTLCFCSVDELNEKTNFDSYIVRQLAKIDLTQAIQYIKAMAEIWNIPFNLDLLKDPTFVGELSEEQKLQLLSLLDSSKNRDAKTTSAAANTKTLTVSNQNLQTVKVSAMSLLAPPVVVPTHTQGQAIIAKEKETSYKNRTNPKGN